MFQWRSGSSFNYVRVLSALAHQAERDEVDFYFAQLEDVLEKTGCPLTLSHHPSSGIFLNALERIAADARKGQTPVLQIVGNGSTNGLWIGNEVIAWDRLAKFLRAINIPTRNNLVVPVTADRARVNYRKFGRICSGPTVNDISDASARAFGNGRHSSRSLT